MMKRETFAIANIYVPMKRRATLDPKKVQEIAESILQVGLQSPILVRQDGERFVLVSFGGRAASVGGVQATGRWNNRRIRRAGPPTLMAWKTLPAAMPGANHICDGCAFFSDHVDAARPIALAILSPAHARP